MPPTSERCFAAGTIPSTGQVHPRAALKPNAPHVCLRRCPGPCQTAAGALHASPGTSRVGGRKGRDGQTADICRTLWSEQSQRKRIYKRSLWGIIIASATEARCQATSRHAHLLFHVCVGLDACLALMFSISTDWSMISKLCCQRTSISQRFFRKISSLRICCVCNVLKNVSFLLHKKTLALVNQNFEIEKHNYDKKSQKKKKSDKSLLW